MAECRGQPALADAGWTDERQIIVSVDPFACDQLLEQGTIKTARIAIVDILDAGLLAQFGDAQPRREALILSPRCFAIKQESEPFVMAKTVGLTAGRNFSEGLGHTMQAKDMELIEGWMFEQVCLS
jgi:hypothetical protein